MLRAKLRKSKDLVQNNLVYVIPQATKNFLSSKEPKKTADAILIFPCCFLVDIFLFVNSEISKLLYSLCQRVIHSIQCTKISWFKTGLWGPLLTSYVCSTTFAELPWYILHQQTISLTKWRENKRINRA